MEGRKNKETLKEEVRRHLEAEKKAYIWVERLALVDNIDQDECNTMLNSIMVSHYCDLIEERSISKLCGYPLCANPLTQTGKQKYHISLREKKVYDASERKCFCSDFCYKASKYIKMQIPESPIWLRTSIKKIKFLDKHDDDLTKKVEVMNEELDKQEKDRECLCSQLDDADRESYRRYDQFANSAEKENKTFSSSLIHLQQQQQNLKTQTSLVKKYNKEEQLDVLDNLRTVLEQWMKEISLEKLSENESKEGIEQPTDTDLSFQMKALNFLSNNPEWVSEAKVSNNFKEKMKIKNDHPRTVPHIHSKSQASMRRKIVKDQLYIALEKVCSVLGIDTSVLIGTDFFKFVNSLRFTSRNIILKPKEWIIATLSLVQIYSTISGEFRELLESRKEELDNFLSDFEKITLTYDDIKILCESVTSCREDISTIRSGRRVITNIETKSSSYSYDASDDEDEEKEEVEDFFDMINSRSGKEFDMEELD